MNQVRLLLIAALLLAAPISRAQETPKPTSVALFGEALQKLAALIEPAPGTPGQTVVSTLKISRADGLPADLLGRELDFAWQAPNRLRLTADINGERYSAGRDGESLWIHAPGKKFGVIGKPGVARFASAPDKLDDTRLGKWKLRCHANSSRSCRCSARSSKARRSRLTALRAASCAPRRSRRPSKR